MADITLPRLVGTRDVAEQIVNDALADERPESVTVSARVVLNAAPSFSDAFIESLLSRGVQRVLIFGGSDDLVSKLTVSAARRGGIEVVPSRAALANV